MTIKRTKPTHAAARAKRRRPAAAKVARARSADAGDIMSKPMLLGYARVSTVDQNLALQRDALTEAGCARIFTEQMSGAVTDRPALHDALEFARSGDTLIVWKLDRLARSMKQLIETVETLRARGIGFRSLTEALDTTTAQGRLVFHMFGGIALAASMSSSVSFGGRPPVRPARRAAARPACVRSRMRLRSNSANAGQPRHRRHPNRTPSWCLSGDALSLHPRRAHCASSRRLRKRANFQWLEMPQIGQK
jgi:hypothetical protein